MSLTLGQTVGPYRVLDKLGAGGMGEVYKARDTKLQRDVAIKILPPLFASNSDRLARFEREAQALASLNHPHIAQIYGVVENPAALVMEFVDGEDLARRIARGAVPVPEAMPIGAQIADAIDAAHERGIIHRDLKPANVLVTADGTVKVLDFGLAKATDPAVAAASGALENSPTFTSPATMTQMGVILGTAAYMAPEQARGKAVDKRADIWAFGVVLFEMLTGRPAFDGESVTDVLAAIVTRDPDWNALPPATPAGVRRVLRRCLARDPRKRLADAGEARYQIEEAIAGTAGSGELTPAAIPKQRRPLVSGLPWAIAAVLGAVAVAGWWRGKIEDAPGIRYTVEPPAATSLSLALRPSLAIAPDGSLAFAATDSGVTRLYVRTQHEFEARPLAGTEGASEPVFSPDGRWIAFYADNRLNRVPVDGGAIEPLATANDPRGLSWDTPGTITFSPESTGGVYQVQVDHPGAPVAVTKLANVQERTHRWPQALPGNKAVLYTVGAIDSPDNYDRATIEATILATGERRAIYKGAAMARYVAPGYLVFARGTTAYAVRFDVDRLQVQGQPTVVVQGVAGDSTTGASDFASSPAGAFAYVAGAAERTVHRLVWVSRNGETEPVSVDRGMYFDVKLSPDGSRLAFQSVGGGGSDIWIRDLERKTLSRLTFSGTNQTPVWSRDGGTIYYVARAADGTQIMRRLADGSRDAEMVTRTTMLNVFLASVSDQAGQALAAHATNARKTDISFIALTKDGGVTPLVSTAFDEYSPSLSPNGRYLAYQSNESSRAEIYVRDVSGGGRWQISTTGGEEPRWSPDGRELYYRNDTQFMAASVETQGTFRNDPPHQLFTGIYNLRSDSGTSYDVDPKGSRFLMIRLADNSVVPSNVRVITNWARELPRLFQSPRAE